MSKARKRATHSKSQVCGSPLDRRDHNVSTGIRNSSPQCSVIYTRCFRSPSGSSLREQYSQCFYRRQVKDIFDCSGLQKPCPQHAAHGYESLTPFPQTAMAGRKCRGSIELTFTSATPPPFSGSGCNKCAGEEYATHASSERLSHACKRRKCSRMVCSAFSRCVREASESFRCS